MSEPHAIKLIRRSKCVTIFSPADIDLACDRCAVIMDITNGTRSRNAIKKRSCQQLWRDRYAETKETNLF